MTRKERNISKKEEKRFYAHTLRLHKLSQSVNRAISASVLPRRVQANMQAKLNTTRWPRFRAQGYALHKIFDRLQKKYPEIDSAHVDDHNFMNSAIFYVPHLADGDFMGLSVFVVPQSGEPTEVFMYPSDIEDNYRVLKKFRKYGTKRRRDPETKFTLTPKPKPKETQK
jgi:hypothetical protein